MLRIVGLSIESFLAVMVDFILVPERHPAFALYEVATVLLSWYYAWILWSYWTHRVDREISLYGEATTSKPK